MFALRRSALTLVSRRSFATAASSTAPPPKQVNILMEIGLGLGLSFAAAMIWKGMAGTQIAQIEAMNAKIKQAKKEGLL